MSAGYLPVILFAGIAKLSYDVRQTRTLSGTMITRPRGLVGAQHITSTILTILLKGVSVEAGFADFAVGTIGVEQTLEAMTGVRIAVTSSM